MASGLVCRTMTCVGMMVAALNAGGCAFGDRHVPIDYQPVMKIKAKAPADVDILPFQSARGLSDERQIGQVRNTYMMVTAKVFCENGDAMEWVHRALAAELASAGFRTGGPASSQPTPLAVTIAGTVHEFLTDVGYNGFHTRLLVRFVVTKNGATKLEKDYLVDDGGSGLTGSADEYQAITIKAIEKLMRRAVPDIIAAIEGGPTTRP